MVWFSGFAGLLKEGTNHNRGRNDLSQQAKEGVTRLLRNVQEYGDTMICSEIRGRRRKVVIVILARFGSRAREAAAHDVRGSTKSSSSTVARYPTKH